LKRDVVVRLCEVTYGLATDCFAPRASLATTAAIVLPKRSVAHRKCERLFGFYPVTVGETDNQKKYNHKMLIAVNHIGDFSGKNKIKWGGIFMKNTKNIKATGF
jgi:hypothetical protein